METSFAHLLSPLSVEEFFRIYWEKKLLHIERNQPDFFGRILNEKVLDEYLRRQDLSPAGFRLAVSGEEVPARFWIRQEKLLNGAVKEVVCPEKLFANFDKGATIIINASQTGIPQLAEACRTLEQEFRISLQSNIYITPPHSQGFAAHYDPHDIISLQIRGSKQWRILDSGENLPTTLRAFRKEPEFVKEFQMREGDLLYIPRGTVHEAFASEHAAIHVNFSFKPRYGFHLLEDLAAVAESEDAFFRKTIPNGFADQAEREKYAAELARKITGLIGKYPVEKLLERQFERFVKNQQIDFRERFTDLLEIDKLNLDSVVAPRAGMTLSVRNEPDGMHIGFGKNEIMIPKFIGSEIFLRGAPFKVGEIDGLITEKGKIELTADFIKKGFLRMEKLK